MRNIDDNIVPNGEKRVLLHTCCAPCCGAIIEWLVGHGVTPVIYYCNPNIYPYEEYLVRKNECTRYAESLGLEVVDADYDHKEWLHCVSGMECEPERGKRCLECFKMRLESAAHYASTHAIKLFTSTLDSSRWKRHDQIVEAGELAASHYPNVEFWSKNWRQGGLQERRSEIVHEQNFYNQRYCGCEFSMLSMHDDKQQVRERIKKLIAVMSLETRAAESATIWERLEQTEPFKQSNHILIYWSMLDEVETPQFIHRWNSLKKIYLPSIQGDNLVVKRYSCDELLVDGYKYGIPEPQGEPLTDLGIIDMVIVPGRAFSVNGDRLGRGRGFYDRLLPLLHKAYKVGVCYKCQLLPFVPTEENDIKMDVII